jgi:hypothetical protein
VQERGGHNRAAQTPTPPFPPGTPPEPPPDPDRPRPIEEPPAPVPVPPAGPPPPPVDEPPVESGFDTLRDHEPWPARCNPTTPIMISAKDTSFQAPAGSPNHKMPIAATIAVPTPDQTA